jgi:hypothetical protein
VIVTVLSVLPSHNLDVPGLSPLARFGVVALIANLVFLAAAAATLIWVERPLSVLASHVLDRIRLPSRRSPQL